MHFACGDHHMSAGADASSNTPKIRIDKVPLARAATRVSEVSLPWSDGNLRREMNGGHSQRHDYATQLKKGSVK